MLSIIWSRRTPLESNLLNLSFQYVFISCKTPGKLLPLIGNTKPPHHLFAKNRHLLSILRSHISHFRFPYFCFIFIITFVNIAMNRIISKSQLTIFNHITFDRRKNDFYSLKIQNKNYSLNKILDWIDMMETN